MLLWSVEKAESIDTEADVSLVSSVHSSDDIDMLPDVAHLPPDDGLGDAGCYCIFVAIFMKTRDGRYFIVFMSRCYGIAVNKFRVKMACRDNNVCQYILQLI